MMELHKTHCHDCGAKADLMVMEGQELTRCPQCGSENCIVLERAKDRT